MDKNPSQDELEQKRRDAAGDRDAVNPVLVKVAQELAFERNALPGWQDRMLKAILKGKPSRE